VSEQHGLQRAGVCWAQAAEFLATLGLLPAAMFHGIGSDSQRPFAIVIVGGLIADLVMSIFLLPTLMYECC